MQYNVEINLIRIQQEIAPCKPNIVAVTKYFGPDAIIDAFEAGIRDFGESRVIEASEKINNLPEKIKEKSKFHFIGHLQTNKVKKTVARFDLIHSVDSLKLARKISDCAIEIGKVQNILLQLNIAQELQKSGFDEKELTDVFGDIVGLPGIKVLGLMCMTPFGASSDVIRDCFKKVKVIRDLLEKDFGYSLPELSMGMSQDYEIAAQEGATILRIGRRLFS